MEEVFKSALELLDSDIRLSINVHQLEPKSYDIIVEALAEKFNELVVQGELEQAMSFKSQPKIAGPLIYPNLAEKLSEIMVDLLKSR